MSLKSRPPPKPPCTEAAVTAAAAVATAAVAAATGALFLADAQPAAKSRRHHPRVRRAEPLPPPSPPMQYSPARRSAPPARVHDRRHATVRVPGRARPRVSYSAIILDEAHMSARTRNPLPAAHSRTRASGRAQAARLERDPRRGQVQRLLRRHSIASRGGAIIPGGSCTPRRLRWTTSRP